jgi:hypothetical protein
MLSSLFDFVEKQCDKHHIDSSHGVIHSKRCVSWVEQMIQHDINIPSDEQLVAIYASAIHDLCDKKYVSIFESIHELRVWLNEQPILSEDMISAILNIIQTMSYSYLYQRKYTDGTLWFPDHGKWQRAYHLVRHADLLEGYHVGRCYLYTKLTYNFDEEESWKRVETLFINRMYKYVSDGWITHPYALIHAPKLEQEARDCFITRKWDYQ